MKKVTMRTTRKQYDIKYNKARKTFLVDKIGRPSSARVSSRVTKIFKYIRKNKIKGKLLDIGCGVGKNTILASEYGFDALGIEISPEALKLCKKLNKIKRSKARFKKYNFLSKPLKQKFDICLDAGCFHHIPRSMYKKYIKNLLYSLNPEGYYFLIVFSYKDKRFPKNRNWKIESGKYSRGFTKKELKNIFQKHFKILKIIETMKPVVSYSVYMKRK